VHSFRESASKQLYLNTLSCPVYKWMTNSTWTYSFLMQCTRGWRIFYEHTKCNFLILADDKLFDVSFLNYKPVRWLNDGCFLASQQTNIYHRIQSNNDSNSYVCARTVDWSVLQIHNSMVWLHSLVFSETFIRKRVNLLLTVCQLTSDLSKVRTFASHVLKDVPKLFTWDGWIFCPYKTYPKKNPTGEKIL
jgi:hypothetical protein